MIGLQAYWAWRRWLLSLLLVQCSGALAAVGEPETHPIFDTSYLIQVLGSLLLVFGCLFGLVFLLRKLNGVQVSDRKAIRVLSSLKVGSREKIMLVDTGENQLLVGVAAGSIRTLHVFDCAVDEAGEGSAHGGNFDSLLRGATSAEGRR